MLAIQARSYQFHRVYQPTSLVLLYTNDIYMNLDSFYKFQAMQSIRKIRKTLERGVSEEWMNKDGFLPMICYFIQCEGNIPIQTEAAWIFTNIAAGSNDQVRMVSFLTISMINF